MNIVVCIKITLDTAELGVDSPTGAPRLEGAPYRLSPLDENALEEAVRLRQQAGGGTVTMLTMARTAPPELLLRGLAMGADQSCLVVDSREHDGDALLTATHLAAALRRMSPWDLVLCGDGSLDQYNRQVGPRIAEALAVPCLTQVARVVELGPGVVRVERALEDRIETVETDLPALLTVVQEINQPRLPTVLQIMAASRKPRSEWRVEELESAALEAELGKRAAQRIGRFAPPSRRKRLRLAGKDAADAAHQLVARLAEDGAVVRR